MSNYRIYRANNNGDGSASEFQLSFKKDEQYNPYLLFLVMAPQGPDNANGDATFLWKEKGITVKLGENDIGEIIAVLDGRKDTLGMKGSLYHQTPNGGNKAIVLNRNEKGGFWLSVSGQDKDKNSLGKYSHSISDGEASILSTLLKAAVVRLFGW